MTYQLNFAALWPYWPELLAGLWVTIQLTAMVTVGGIAIGIYGAALRSGRPSWLSRLWGLYVELIRNTPFVVQLFFIVLGLPTLGWKLTAGEAALLAMLINLGAYSTEIIRAGIQVTPKGQWEAARVLGLTRSQTFLRIILPPALTLFTSAFLVDVWHGSIVALPKGQWEASRCLGLSFSQTLCRVVAPQAMRIAIAPTVGFSVQVIKGTALASIIGFIELTKAGTMLNNVTYQPFKVFGLVALGYFLMCYPLSYYSHYLEKKFNAAHHH